MSQIIRVNAKVYPKKENYKEVRDIIAGNVEKAKREIGNISYELYVDHDNEHELIVMEKWETKADYLRHEKSDYLNEFKEKTKGKLEKETIVEIFNYIKG